VMSSIFHVIPAARPLALPPAISFVTLVPSCAGTVHLLSFPTRRSSDLRHRTDTVVPGRAGSAVHRLGAAAPRRLGTGGAAAPRRSEEHTSELQSRFDIVCRLLLEKKKL